MTRQWLRFALGREDAADDDNARKALATSFRDGGGKVATCSPPSPAPTPSATSWSASNRAIARYSVTPWRRRNST